MSSSGPQGPIDTCERCGQPHRTRHGGQACVSHKKSGVACTNAPRLGGTVCNSHGGKAPQVVAANARNLARKEALKRLEDVGVVAINDPADAYADLAAEIVAWKGQIAQMVNELNDNYRFTDDKGAEHLDARVALFERAMDRCQKVLKDWLVMGLEERRVRLEEIRVVRVGVLMDAWASAHGIDPRTPAELALLDRLLPILDGAPPPVIELESTEAVVTDG